MMMIAAEVSAAPHLPHALRPATAESHTLASLMQILSAAQELEVIEENGELRLVSHAAS